MNPSPPDSAWWSLLWDSGALALAVLGPDRCYRQVNDAWCRVLQADAATLLQWSYERVGHPLDLDAELDAFVRLADGALSVNYTRRFRTAGGHEVTATVHAFAGADGAVLQLIIPGASTSPATSGISATILERLAVALSHDAQEPVRKLGVSAGLLLQRLEPLLEPHEREHALLQSMEDHAVRLGRQMRALVRYARLGEPRIDPAPHRVSALVAAACDQVPFPAAITLHTTIAPAVQVRGDRAQLISALVELLRNTIAPHAPGRPTTVTISAEVTADRCTISVTDDGIGIAAVDQPRLFRLFAASGPGAGTGVGLATVQAVADGHGGTVRLHSTPGVGTVVHLSLPH